MIVNKPIDKFYIFSFILSIVLVLMNLVSSAPPASAATVNESVAYGAGYSAVLYDNSNGLPTSEANAIVQSNDGFIWIGSYSGLIRYDGNSFYRFDSSTGIASVVSLFVDSKDRLWIGTNDKGIVMMKDNEFTFFNNEDGLESLSIRSIQEDNNGNIILATTMGLSYIDNETKLHRLDDSRLNSEYIYQLDKTKDGVILGTMMNGNVFTLDKLRIKNIYDHDTLGYPSIDSVYADPQKSDYVYLGTDSTQILYARLSDNLKDPVVIDTGEHHTINCMKLINGKLWVCTENGIGYYSDNKYTILQNLPVDNSIDRIIEDYEGNLWFASSRQGVMKIVNNNFIDISHLAKLDPMVVNSTCLMNDKLYIAADNGLFILDENYKQVENELTKLLTNTRIRCIKKDKNNILWLCTYGDNALVRYDAKNDSYKCYNQENGLASNKPRMVKELSDGRLAVATNAGINIIENDKITEIYNDKDGMNNLEILNIEEGEDGVLYLGSDGDGIYVLRDKKIKKLGINNGLISEVILRIKKDPDKNAFWIITSNSIAYMENESIKTITEFPYANNFDIFFDKNNRLWVVSSNGIYIVKKDDVINNGDIDYSLLDTKCGLPSVATANSYSYLSENGDLYIAGTTGVSSINIYQNPYDDSNVRVAVPYITVDDKYIAVGDKKEITIPSDSKRINIYAEAFTYSLNNPHLTYCLEGFDEKPFEVTKQEMTNITYTNLKGGTYTFKLNMINTMTGKVEKSTEIKITKEMALYENWWFRILMVGLALIVLLLLLYIIYKKKTKRLLKKQAETKKLVDEMTTVFARCIDMKDVYTNGHSMRVAKYTSMIAKRLGKSDKEVAHIYNIALLHDIGKIGIPDKILNKPGRLDEDEYKVMKQHSSIGRDILKDVRLAPELAVGAGYHHEKYDGTGYPNGLKGDEIPEVAQIISVADTFDAMFSTRPYRKKMKIEDVIKELKRVSGTQLNPKYVDTMLTLIEEGEIKEEERAGDEEEKKND